MPPGCFALKGETTIAAGDLYTLSVSFADSSPNGGAFPETCRFPAGGNIRDIGLKTVFLFLCLCDIMGIRCKREVMLC